MQATKETFEDSVIGEDITQDNPGAEEREESGTVPPGMERTTQNNSNQTATPRRLVKTAEPAPLQTSGDKQLPSHLKDFIIDRP